MPKTAHKVQEMKPQPRIHITKRELLEMLESLEDHETIGIFMRDDSAWPKPVMRPYRIVMRFPHVWGSDGSTCPTWKEKGS